MRLGNIIFMTPFIFGLAHVHHFYEFRVTHPQVPVAAAVARSVLQLSYTSLFGAYATFLFLRTGSFLAVFLVHAFCNSMGLPRFWGFVQPYWLYQNTAQTLIAVQRWTAVYYTLLVVGLITWWALLWKLTESNSPLAVF
jgi:prenyl protein peptidase